MENILNKKNQKDENTICSGGFMANNKYNQISQINTFDIDDEYEDEDEYYDEDENNDREYKDHLQDIFEEDYFSYEA